LGKFFLENSDAYSKKKFDPSLCPQTPFPQAFLLIKPLKPLILLGFSLIADLKALPLP
jgi:hypothetical protein